MADPQLWKLNELIAFESLTLEQRVLNLELWRRKVDESLAGAPGIPSRLIVSSPVDPLAFGAWGGDWFDATGYDVEYGDLKHIHTGADLNRPGYRDSGAPVYAAADGIVRYSGVAGGWQGQVVVIEHSDRGAAVWTRYAHLMDVIAKMESLIVRGTQIGVIADYNQNGPKGDHLHYDVARRIDLGKKPADWPGIDQARVLRDYINPLEWHTEHTP